MSETQPGSRIGSRFGPYQLRRLLGRGGMAVQAVTLRRRLDRRGGATRPITSARNFPV